MIDEIKLSAEFKAQTTKAIFSISLFIFIYVLILLLAIVFTIVCVGFGIMLMVVVPTVITIALGIGVGSLGVFILIFLIKFIFKANKADLSHLVEIREEDEPKLFQFITEIVEEVGTDFPKNIYLSADVNASVFYDSNFWSMFLPVKKNLQIGLGLVNAVTVTEFKSILAHEFGHFSQKTMKVGSYVYNVNQVIFNLLFDNESYEKLVQGWGNMSGLFSIFASLATLIIRGIQWLLRRLYEIVNKNYMGLSREMEFHADEIAANVTGFEPLKYSLTRLSLAEHSFNRVLTFYDGRLSKNLKSENLYKEHTFVMNLIAEDSNFPIIYDYPRVTLEELNKFNRSKLVLKDQWASHPSTEDRIVRLEQTNIVFELFDQNPANSMFTDIEETQKELTSKLFNQVKTEGEAATLSLKEFILEFKQELGDTTFSKFYNGYYDNRNPILSDFELDSENVGDIKLEDLFSESKVDLVYEAIALQNDIELLNQISSNLIPVKTFDYDGEKYSKNECEELLQKLSQDLTLVNEGIGKNDVQIFQFFSQREKELKKDEQLKTLYQEFFKFDSEFDSKNDIYIKLSSQLDFVNFNTPFEQIESNFFEIHSLEKEFKKELKDMLENSNYKIVFTDDIKGAFKKYLSKEWDYFKHDRYLDDNLNVLFTALNNYTFMLSKGYFNLKRQLLVYQEELE